MTTIKTKCMPHTNIMEELNNSHINKWIYIPSEVKKGKTTLARLGYVVEVDEDYYFKVVCFLQGQGRVDSVYRGTKIIPVAAVEISYWLT